MRKKLCAIVVIAATFLTLAVHIIQRGHFPSLSLATPITLAFPASERTRWEAVVKATASHAHHPNKLDRAATADPEDEDEDEDEEDDEDEEEEEEEGAEPGEDSHNNDNRLCGCSGSCVSDPGGSEWFSARYDPKQLPVLRDTNNNLEPDALKWWLSLQRSGNDQTIEEVMSEMFKVISPPAEDFRPRRSRCRSCAVVGNSGNLQRSGNGKAIDAHNFVIRMNKAVTRGFEGDVGNRTTHHLLYPESAVDLQRGVSLVLLPFKLRDLEWLSSALSTGLVKMTYMRVKDRVQADKDKVLVVNPAFFKYVNDRWTERHGRYPSTGMLAIVFALHTCDQVSVFGYGADKEGNWHHYWEENRYAGAFRKTGVHSADFETQVIQQLAKEGRVSLHA